MRELVAIDTSSASIIVSTVRKLWDNGDSALVVDQRLPTAAKTTLVEKLGVHRVFDGTSMSTRLSTAEPMREDDALVVATSGTSGETKGVIHTHAGLRAASIATAAALGCGAEAHWLACLPLSHIGGFGVVTRALHTGAGLTVLDGFDPSAVESSQATHVSLVATALARIEATLFRRILLGGSRPPAAVPHNVTTTYGLTESCGGIVYDRRPIPGVSVRIADDGEVLLRGPMIMDRYRNADLVSPVDPDGWLHTADFGSISEGLLHVHGRRGDLIITGGENVWPDAVERVLATHPDIVECCVAGIDDPEWGQRVVAWIVSTSHGKPSIDEIRDHVAEELPRFCAPREVRYVASLPRTALGKVIRRQLAQGLASPE